MHQIFKIDWLLFNVQDSSISAILMTRNSEMIFNLLTASVV